MVCGFNYFSKDADLKSNFQEDIMNKKILRVTGFALFFALLLSVSLYSLADMAAITEEQIAAIYEQLAKLEEENGKFYTWTIEEKYQWQEDNWHIIKERETSILGLPREEDIDENEARIIALTSIQKKYGSIEVYPGPTHEGSESVQYIVNDPHGRVWKFDFFLYNVGGRIGTFHVTIDAKTGIVIEVDDGKGGHS